MKASAVRAWNRFFYEGGSALSYSCFGSVYYWYVLATAILSPLSRPWELEPIFVSDIFLFRLFHLPHPGAASLLWVIHAWWITLAFCAIGLWGRPMRIVCFLLGTYVCGQKQNFGIVFDQETTLMLSFIVITAAPAFPYTILGWLRSRAAAPLESAQYRWPIQLMRLLLVYILFSAGLLKLWFSGFYWLTQNVVYGIAVNPLHHKRYGFAVDWLAAHEGLCRVLTVLAFLMELSFPFVLFSRRLRAPLVLAACSMFIGIFVVVGYHFLFYMGPLFLAFLPWEKRNTQTDILRG